MNEIKRRFVGDFETTVFEGQTFTEVWASGIVEIGTEDVHIFHSIGETYDFLYNIKENLIVYYHNLKFDGAFWIDYLLRTKKLQQATIEKEGEAIEFIPMEQMQNNTFRYSISALGYWYSITLKVNNHIIDIRDSLKLLPFSVRKLGQSFNTKHKKLDMEYTGVRYAGCEITPKEQEYLANDLLVVKEALEIMFEQGHTKLTIGACCLAEYTKILGGKKVFEGMFPNMYEIEIDKNLYGTENAGEYIRKSYRGGWCYLVKGKEKQIKHNGITADVNSLYPSMMHSQSGNYFPSGKPHFWKGNFIPEECEKENRYWFIRIRCRFKLKKGKLPFIQIKNTYLYNFREMLTSSDFYDKKNKRYVKRFLMDDGTVIDSTQTMTMTMTDYKLFLEHYDVERFEILDGCWFVAFKGIFDEYINVYKKIKMESKGAIRELAKLFLNNLYGKLATYIDSSFKYAVLREDGTIGFATIEQYDKRPGYIPCGSAITSYARNFTIRTAQSNFYGVNKRGFIYADTDSIHCDLSKEELKNVPIHESDFCHWKIESEWDVGWFVRPKTYIEHIVSEGEPFYSVKCAGMPDKCKNLFLASLTQDIQKYGDYIETEEDEKFAIVKRELTDFDIGLTVSGKLVPKRITGGVVLKEVPYEMRAI